VKTNRILLLISAAVCCGAVGAAHAQSKEEVASKLNGVAPADLAESPIDGIYQVQLGSRVAYVTTDGHYLMQGELFDLQTSVNLTEQARATARVQMIASVPADQMIVFAPPDGQTKHVVTIFTDIDCGYCRQFHREIEQVNAMGIEVHYLFFPRTGRDTESWAKAEKVWCVGEEGRKAALTRAKLGGDVPDATCADNPVGRHYDLGQEVGVRGTPAIVAANGEIVGGYMPPADLLKTLDSLAQ